MNLKELIPTYETRAEAEEKVDKQKRYKQIIEILSEHPEMTAKEIAVRMKQKGWTPTDERNFAAPRLTELAKKGFVEPIGKKKCVYTGRTVAVWAIREDVIAFAEV